MARTFEVINTRDQFTASHEAGREWAVIARENGRFLMMLGHYATRRAANAQVTRLCNSRSKLLIGTDVRRPD